MGEMNRFVAADDRYHGLTNQGATCYLNSVLQALFMTKDFREAVRTCENHGDVIDPELKALFDNLEEKTTTTCDLTEKLGIDSVYEQRDAAEYFQKILLRTSYEASQIFRGRLDQKTTCCVCRRETINNEPFWYLPLAIGREVFHVKHAIEEFFLCSKFEEDNQMYCETCDAKVDATFANIMEHHPDVLVLLLKRFYFSLEFMSYIKNNQPVDIPRSLLLPRISIQHSVSVQAEITYQLYAVVNHFGDLTCGHYATNIKIEEDSEHRWYEFDDTRITPLNAAVFQENIRRSQTAYLLFYQRQTKTNGSSSDVTDDSGQCQDVEKRRQEEEGSELTSVAALVSSDPHSDVDRKQAADEVKETPEHEDDAGKVNSDDLKEEKLSAEGEKTPHIDHEARDRCSAGGHLHKHDASSGTRKRRKYAHTHEPTEKQDKFVADQSDGTVEHPSDGDSGKDVSEEDDENMEHSGRGNMDGENCVDDGRAVNIPTNDQRGEQEVEKERNQGLLDEDDGDQHGKKDCLSTATSGNDGEEEQPGDEEAKSKERSADKESKQKEMHVSEKMNRDR